MKLLYLGTGGANWLNGLDSTPEFFRRNSSALVDGELLIDFGDGVIDALDTYGCDKNRIKYIINTHKHTDHYSPDELKILEECGAKLVTFVPGDIKTLGKYTVTAFRGNHAAEPTTVYIISDGEKELFYGLDGAWLMPDVFHEIIDRRASALVLDATYGFNVYNGVYEHNNLGMIVEMAAVLNQYCGKIYLSHLSRVYHNDHETIVKEMAKHSVSVAYDGLEIEI